MSRSASRQRAFDFGPEVGRLRSQRKREWHLAYPNSVFLAVKPDAEAAEQGMEMIRLLCRCHGTRPERREGKHLHATIHPIGAYAALSREALPYDVVAALCAGDVVEARAFRAEFDLLENFKGEANAQGRPTWKIVLRCRNRVAWMPLIERIGTAQRRAGLPAASPSSFDPHLTLIYRGWQIPAEVLHRPVAWTVRRLLLVNSIYGKTTHEHLGQWPLRG